MSMSRKILKFTVVTSDENFARGKAMEWYSSKQNLSVDSVEHTQWGCQVSISYDEEDEQSTTKTPD